MGPPNKDPRYANRDPRNMSRDPRKAFRKQQQVRDPLDPHHRPNGRRRARSKREVATSWARYACPCVIFFLIFGVAFCIIFGLIPIDQLKSLFGYEVPPFGGENNNGDGGGGRTEAPTVAPTPAPPFVFMQCPESGECCNGLESNCNLKPSDIMWPTVHNAMHDDLLGNNRKPLEDALNAGYRGLQLDVCVCENMDTKEDELVFCHGLCPVGRRTFDDVFPNINKFLNQNPTESIIINFELSVGNPTAAAIWTAISQYQGLNKKTYIHDHGAFPSMRQLQQDGKRLILFKHGGGSCVNLNGNGCSNRIGEFHQHTLETHWKFDTIKAISEFETSCAGTRGGDGRKDFYQINNFITNFLGSNEAAAKVINAEEFLIERITQCEKLIKQDINFVSVDFWQQGDLLRVCQEKNIERARRRRSLRSRVSSWIHG